MSVRKRTWKSKDGETREAWIVDYSDQLGSRHLKTFRRKRDADQYHATVALDVRSGIHTADSSSITLAEAAKLWLASGEAAGLERATLTTYRQHAELHIVPFLGLTKLSAVTVPLVRHLEDRLRAAGRSPAIVKHAIGALGSILADALERGLVAQNVVRNLRTRRHRGKAERHERRAKGKLKAGVDIPTPDEVRAIIGKLGDRWRPLILTAIFTGLRASELRGLRWADLDLARGELHVRQRADRYNTIGPPKSEAGERTVPLMPMVVNALRTWKLACPPGDLDLAFPDRRGGVESLINIVRLGWKRAQIAAGVVSPQGRAKYTGLHALRHFYASWCINRRADGGLELPLKVVQNRLGHANISITADVYGHLFPRADDGDEMAAAERAFLGG
jgi:integrase